MTNTTTDALLPEPDLLGWRRDGKHVETCYSAEQMRAIIERLTAERDEAQGNYLRACGTVADMHAAAVGEFGTGPRRGVVEDVQDLRAERNAALEDARRLRAVLCRVDDNPTLEYMAGGVYTIALNGSDLIEIRAALAAQKGDEHDS